MVLGESYYVVLGCGNPVCLPKEYTTIINAISYDSARNAAAVLRNDSVTKKCHKCGRQMGYYAVISECKDTEGPSQIV